MATDKITVRNAITGSAREQQAIVEVRFPETGKSSGDGIIVSKGDSRVEIPESISEETITAVLQLSKISSIDYLIT